jgi:hypothetical protein
LSLAGSEPQSQAVMSRLAGEDLRRKPNTVKLAPAVKEPQVREVMSKQAGSDYAQQARRSQFGSGRQAIADAGSNVQAGSVRLCARR